MRTRKPVSIEIKLADPTLEIEAYTIKNTRESIDFYQAKVEDFYTKAKAASGSRRGAFLSHQSQALTNRERWEKELAFQLEWLRRHRPRIYEEVTE